MPKKKQLKDYKILSKIGRGTFGTVYKAFNIATKNEVALKKIDKSKIDINILGDLNKLRKLEIEKLRHENLCEFIEYFEEGKCYCFVFQLLNSKNTLQQYFSEFPEQLSLSEIKLIIKGITEGLYHLTQEKINYTSLNPANIFLQQTEHELFTSVKLTDYGTLRKSQEFSIFYPPEECMEENVQSGIWSLGMILATLFSDTHNIKDYREKQIIEIATPEKLQNDCIDFLNSCLQLSPKYMKSAEELLAHPFLCKNTHFDIIAGELPFKYIFDGKLHHYYLSVDTKYDLIKYKEPETFTKLKNLLEESKLELKKAKSAQEEIARSAAFLKKTLENKGKDWEEKKHAMEKCITELMLEIEYTQQSNWKTQLENEDIQDYEIHAKIAEQSKRFDEMLEIVKERIKLSTILTTEEGNVLGIAYRQCIKSRFHSLKKIDGMIQRDKSGIIKKQLNCHRSMIIREIIKLSTDVEKILDECISNNEVQDDRKIYYMTLKAECINYRSQCEEGDKTGQKVVEQYKEAQSLGAKTLPPTHPVRLGTALCFSTYYLEYKKDFYSAGKIAKDAFDEAMPELDDLEDDEYEESYKIIDLLKDRLVYCASEQKKQAG